MRALLVDDSSVVLLCLRSFVSKYGECDLARDGQQGLDAFMRSVEEQRPYDLICLDLQMPGLDGWTLVGLIRAREQEFQVPTRSKILVITGTADAAAVVNIKKKGADGYLLKPVSGEKLLDQLVRLGLVTLSSWARAEKLAAEVAALTDSDDIPSVLLARMIRRMAISLERQALRDAASLARAESTAAREADKPAEDSQSASAQSAAS
jgi:two-component system chemotaxis response regulator CheY